MAKFDLNYSSILICFLAVFLILRTDSHAQFRPQPTPNDTLVSPRILADNKVQFSIYAPKAETVRLNAGDIPGSDWTGTEMTKRPDGVWEVTLGPIEPGAYRYTFLVDGVTVVDPKSSAISESNGNVWSLVYVPGADFMDTKDVPHGAVAEVTYFSKSLNRFRRMHVYTPPGYELSQVKYPVFYLLHGAFDCDDSWSTVGRAGFILDNLIAAKKAKPMIVVMPAGHTGPFRFGPGVTLPMEEFVKDFESSVMPYVETHYRINIDRQSRAIAGLSMGGAHTLDIAIPNLEKFAYIGVYSSGIFGITGGPAGPPASPTWESKYLKTLDDARLKQGLKLFWFATGKDDFLVETSRATVDMFKKHGFDVIYNETSGAHTWINWRLYLNEFAPMLFQ